MPRKRDLPPYVYRGRSAYELRRYEGAGKRMSAERLCPLDAPLSEVWRLWEQRQSEQQVQSVRWLFGKYLDSDRFAGRAARTREEQRRQADGISAAPLRGGMAFGDAPLSRVTPGVITGYIDRRARQGAPTAGNREVALLSAAWSWARARDLVRIDNPCRAAERNPESARTRYVTDAEYSTAHALASPAYLPIAMELAYLCRMRRGEILRLVRSDLLDEGVLARRTKGSRTQLIGWSDRLRAAIDAGKALPGESIYILHDDHGAPLTRWAFASAWTRLQARWIRATGAEGFHFHDLKAKGVSDFQGDKQQAAGHRDARMVHVYDRKIGMVESTR